MPFGTRKRLRPAFQFIDPILPIRASEKQKIKEISNQGLENTSQREEARPSAKAPIEVNINRDNGKGVNRPTPIINKADPSVGNPDAPHPTAQDMKAIGNIAGVGSKHLKPQSSHNSHTPQAKVLQIITDKVKTNVKKIEKKIENLTAKGLRGQVEREIKRKEQQLSKLRALLLKCPTCN